MQNDIYHNMQVWWKHVEYVKRCEITNLASEMISITFKTETKKKMKRIIGLGRVVAGPGLDFLS